MEKKWVAIWGNASDVIEHRPEAYAKDITLRYPVFLPFGGTSVRIRLDNFCGKEAVHIAGASVALADPEKNPYTNLNCSVRKESVRIFHFGGSGDILLRPGESCFSDPVELNVPERGNLCISLYLDTYTSMTAGVLASGPLSSGFFSYGNQIQSTDLPENTTKGTNNFYFLSDVDVLTESDRHSFICFGDSITAQCWPDELKLLRVQNPKNRLSVIRRAVSGSRMLRQYDCIQYDSYGLAGKNCFEHDLDVSGADEILLLHGINDIIHPVGTEINRFRPLSDYPSAEDMIQGYSWYAEKAREKNLKICFATLTPVCGWRTYADFREKTRLEINEWIRHNPWGYGVIDFAKVLGDENNPLIFRKDYDSGDHLHPSAAAYRRMAELVNEYLR